MVRAGRSPDDLLRRGLDLHRDGRIAEARRHYERALRADPDSPDARTLIGLCDLDEGRPKQALAAFDAALGRRPDDPFAHANRSEALERLGDHAGALAAQAEAARLAPAGPGIQARLARLLRTAGRDAEALTAFQAALAADPEDADLAFELAGYLFRLEFRPQAVLTLRHMLAVAPDRSDGRMMLADLLSVSGESAEALAVLDEAPVADPLLDLARTAALTALFRFDDAERCIRAVLPALSGNAVAHHLLGQILHRTARFDEAAAVLEKARALAPDDASIGFRLGFCYLRLGRLSEGWELFDLRFDADPGSVRNRRTDVPAWDGRPMPDRTLFLWSDQGVGDVFRSAGLFDELRPLFARIVLETGPKNVPWLRRLFPWMDVRPNAMNVASGLPVRRDFDVHLPLGSLPRLLRPSLDAFPDRPAWITADPARADALRRRTPFTDARPVVGLAWRGRAETPLSALHYTGLDALAPLLDAAPHCSFVSLQYGDTAAELDAFAARTGVTIHRFEDCDLFDDLEAAIALTSLADVVISPNATSADIAGALGVRTIRYGVPTATAQLGPAGMPWYPCTDYVTAPPAGPARSVVPVLADRLRDCLGSTVSG